MASAVLFCPWINDQVRPMLSVPHWGPYGSCRSRVRFYPLTPTASPPLLGAKVGSPEVTQLLPGLLAECWGFMEPWRIMVGRSSPTLAVHRRLLGAAGTYRHWSPAYTYGPRIPRAGAPASGLQAILPSADGEPLATPFPGLGVAWPLNGPLAHIEESLEDSSTRLCS